MTQRSRLDNFEVAILRSLVKYPAPRGFSGAEPKA